MKFLCVPCDEPMKIQESKGPDDGGLTLIFGCPACRRQVALLTNPMETQLVRSMDVQIGPFEPCLSKASFTIDVKGHPAPVETGWPAAGTSSRLTARLLRTNPMGSDMPCRSPIVTSSDRTICVSIGLVSSATRR